MLDNLFKFKIDNNMRIYCNNEELYSHLLLYINKQLKENLIILVPTIEEATKLYNNLIYLFSETYLFPEDDYLSQKSLAISPEFLYERMELLNNITKKEKKIVICNLMAFTKKLPNRNEIKNSNITLKVGDIIKKDELLLQLDKIGYNLESITTEIGEYSTRGFVIDIFPFASSSPIRIELFDNEIESIKEYDINTQITKKVSLESIVIKPLKDNFGQLNNTIVDYVNNPYIIVQDENQIKNLQKSINMQKEYYKDIEEINYKELLNKEVLYIETIQNLKSDIKLEAKDITNEVNSLENLKEFVINHKDCYLYLNNYKNIKEIPNLTIVKEYLNKSFSFENKNYISINDVYNIKHKKNYKSNYKLGNKIQKLEHIEIGDYVVHKDHGIGIYDGIKSITKNGIKKDYLLINYKDADKLYIPVEKLNSLYKYSSKDGMVPKIHKLNSKDWEKTKYKIKNKIKDISEELIKLYKERNKIKITPLNVDTAEQLVFENEFPYEETLDQIKATNEIKKDMEKDVPMERLLCGDVGYGKTEVIFRAMFKAVLNGKQVAYLCPTTILAKQQFNSALNRFKNHAVNIAILTRHTTLKEEKEIIEKLETGKIDILFGTHKLFNKSVKYKDLGLLVIDEEHKFGVEHKEQIKERFSSVHVLSVSATPIPRSLQMSLTKIRDMSLIETAPKNRYPVQTYVINEDETILKSAIEKEIARNGQVFIILNDISKLSDFSNYIGKLFPNLIIRYAHGKMSKNETDEIMEAFSNKEIDILLATTIIENGIDIPNANTIIVIDADRFGLSQLYQIRGRVGRSNKIAYAYLMFKNNRILNETAKKRLEAIKEFTALGSGYKISLQDLKIRGAGDLLGREQAGFIDSVGTEMYLELINEELNPVEEKTDDSNEVSDKFLNETTTHIDEKYTTRDDLIIELHEMINTINSHESYLKIKYEIEDRYGFIDSSLNEYLKQKLLLVLMKKYEFKTVVNNKYIFTFMIPKKTYEKLEVGNLFMESIKISNRFNFKYKNEYIVVNYNKLGAEEVFIDELLKFTLHLEKEIKQ